jgi:hypothetical protein
MWGVDEYTRLLNSRAALYMDSSSLANNFFDQSSDANVYLAFRGRRYLLAHYVYAHSGSSKGQWAPGPQSSVGFTGADIFI